MKLIIEIPDYEYRQIKEVYEKNDIVESTYSYIYHGTPLDDVKAEIVKAYEDATMYSCNEELSRFASRVCGILGDIGKSETQKPVGLLNQSLEDAIDCS